MTHKPPNEQAKSKAANCGEPSYVWRAGQERRLEMIRQAAGDLLKGLILDNGCGVGMYSAQLSLMGGHLTCLEYDFGRARETRKLDLGTICAAGERLPFQSQLFDFILSHEVLEHVQDDRQAASEMVRTLRPGGRIVLFAPNRGYPFETHGIYWQGKYHFGNIPLVNYLPDNIRDRLVPHVKVYTHKDLQRVFDGLPVRVVRKEIIFGAYDNIITRMPKLGRLLRSILQGLEKTAFKVFGLSHFWVLEKK
jgi:SAM-dependent methyltransferase